MKIEIEINMPLAHFSELKSGEAYCTGNRRDAIFIKMAHGAAMRLTEHLFKGELHEVDEPETLMVTPMDIRKIVASVSRTREDGTA